MPGVQHYSPETRASGACSEVNWKAWRSSETSSETSSLNFCGPRRCPVHLVAAGGRLLIDMCETIRKGIARANETAKAGRQGCPAADGVGRYSQRRRTGQATSA